MSQLGKKVPQRHASSCYISLISDCLIVKAVRLIKSYFGFHEQESKKNQKHVT